jgi:hypothetical protein
MCDGIPHRSMRALPAELTVRETETGKPLSLEAQCLVNCYSIRDRLGRKRAVDSPGPFPPADYAQEPERPLVGC